MARTAQTARAHDDYPGFKTHKANFTDHAGLYSTLPLDLEGTNVNDLTSYLSHEVAQDAQCDEPVFEIYAPLPDEFACVEHSKREVAHRSSRRQSKDTFLIPKVVAGPYDSRKYGFLIVITSSTWHGGEVYNDDTVDPEGPLFVWFDRRFSIATAAQHALRLEDHITPRSYFGEEDTVLLPEKMEIEVQRIQKTSYMRRRLTSLYQHSTSDDLFDIDYLGEDEDQGLPDTFPEQDDCLHDSTETLALSAMKIAKHGSCTSSYGIEGEPDLRYVVYVPFLHQPGQEGEFERTARLFTSTIVSRFEPGRTVTFEFRKPPKPTLSSILDSQKAYMASKPSDYTGALTSFAPAQTLQERFLSATDNVHARLYPIARSESLQQNLPATSQFEPYRTFIVILDKPDFINEAGVLFLLTDGGKQKKERPFSDPDSDSVATHLWRSAGMDEVRRRLAMQVMMPVAWETNYAASEAADAVDGTTD